MPLYYRIADNQLTQAETVQAVGGDSSGEVETFVFAVDGEMYVSIASDHTDRKLETYSVALSKQVCVKPVARAAGAGRRGRPLGRAGHPLVHRRERRARAVPGRPLASLRTPQDLIAGYTGGAAVLPEGAGMTCGTVGAIGGIRPSADFSMELHDPRRQRSLRHRYHVEELPVVA